MKHRWHDEIVAFLNGEYVERSWGLQVNWVLVTCISDFAMEDDNEAYSKYSTIKQLYPIRYIPKKNKIVITALYVDKVQNNEHTERKQHDEYMEISFMHNRIFSNT